MASNQAENTVAFVLERLYKMASDKTGASGNKDVHTQLLYQKLDLKKVNPKPANVFALQSIFT
jgi:hypothetical protein